MTNEQLAILIRNYALRLDELVEKLDDELPESNERHLKWARKDGVPMLNYFVAVANIEKNGPSDDIEQVTGDFICLDGLRQFSDELWTQINELNAAEKLNAIKRQGGKNDSA